MVARWGMAVGELSHDHPLLSSSIFLVCGTFTVGRSNVQTWSCRHLCSKNRILLVPPTSAHEKTTEGAFKAQVVNIFEADSKFEAWLAKNKIWNAEDFALNMR